MKENTKQKPFIFLDDIEPSILGKYLNTKDANSIATILYFREPEYIANAMYKFEYELKVKVSIAIATIKYINYDVIANLERTLKEELDIIENIDNYNNNHSSWLIARTLNDMGVNAQDILMNINDINPSLADNIRNYMFVFEDIIALDASYLMKIMSNMETKNLAIALFSLSQDSKDKFISAMSPRGKERLQKEFQLLGKLKVKDVEDAQNKMLYIAYSLVESGEIERPEK
jgi:flagellar motor switch protein FliG